MPLARSRACNFAGYAPWLPTYQPCVLLAPIATIRSGAALTAALAHISAAIANTTARPRQRAMAVCSGWATGNSSLSVSSEPKAIILFSCETKRPCARSLRTAAIGDPPDRAVSILADEQRAVMRHRDADGARPNRGVVNDKAGHEVLVFATRLAVLEPHAHHFVAGALRPVPRAVLGGERIAGVFGRKLVAAVDDHPHRGGMCLDQHVGHGDLVLEVRPLAAVARVFVGAKIVPGPAVEGAIAHARHEVGHKIVAETVALVGRAPEIAALRVHGEPHAVAQPAGEHA